MNNSPSNPKSTFERFSSSDCLTTGSRQVMTRSWTENIRQFLIRWLVGREPELKVWRTSSQFEANSQDSLWSAYNPATGQRINNVSEAEMRRWIEQR
ncbi:MAG: hypothetical protein HC899_28995 [Leptolyngbyaceae cyanobacterium SM1_4_3]|nr:hypothetical protein [Leptolyngbyaceae cyanobacterium SM1_4_3]NJN92312.1 hypothetical protein [Leptolyngbyaceae cyanobacterium SL_5_14]